MIRRLHKIQSTNGDAFLGVADCCKGNQGVNLEPVKTCLKASSTAPFSDISKMSFDMVVQKEPSEII